VPQTVLSANDIDKEEGDDRDIDVEATD